MVTMNPYGRFFLILISFFHATTHAHSFAHQLEALIHQHLGNASVGLIIQEAKSGHIVFQRRSQENFYPASNTKLFTAMAALKFLGSNFQYQTSLHSSGKMQGSQLTGDLYLVFRGDPSLTPNDLLVLLMQLKAQGIHTIQGNLVIDDQSFSGSPYAPGWTWDSIPWYYSAPITSIILNENKVRLKLTQKSPSQKLLIEQTNDELPRFPLYAQVKTSLRSEQHCQFNAYINNNAIYLNGCWQRNKAPSTIELALDNMPALVKTLIQQNLTELNIRLNGQIIFNKAPNLPAIASHYSPPLQDLLFKVLAESNNVYSESLTKTLGLLAQGQGTFQGGTQAIQNILNPLIPVMANMRLYDGSGQSRYNIISPFNLCQLLYTMYHDPDFPLFYASLSVAGKNGTLAHRMQDPHLIGKIVAKTGSATGTSALSGYLTTLSGEEYVFALLINQSNTHYEALKAFEDKLCHLLVKSPWKLKIS